MAAKTECENLEEIKRKAREILIEIIKCSELNPREIAIPIPSARNAQNGCGDNCPTNRDCPTNAAEGCGVPKKPQFDDNATLTQNCPD